MRKIENEMVWALRSGRNFHNSNTDVVCENGKKVVFLHGNDIYKEENGKRFFSFCGWDTNTTRSRLRALGVDLISHNGKRYNGTKEITDFYGWNEC
jgi:hypothetical protein